MSFLSRIKPPLAATFIAADRNQADRGDAARSPSAHVDLLTRYFVAPSVEGRACGRDGEDDNSRAAR